MLVGPDVADRVGGGIRVAVGVTVEAGDALAGLQAAAIIGGVELLLREGRDQQTQAFELFGVEEGFE